MELRTDLALEAKALWERSAERTTRLEGVAARERTADGVKITEVEILDEKGAQALGKPVGSYITLEPKRSGQTAAELSGVLAEELRRLMGQARGERVLVVGLGNRAVTPDAIGPETVDRLFLTRHLIEHLPKQFGACRSVSALCTGVLATTGMESLELLRGAVSHVQPDCVVAVDALAAGSAERLCSTVQLSDSGIVPGSGVGNRRAALDRASLGVPVFCLGVPTVMDASSLRPSPENEPLIVTPRDIDAKVRFFGRVLAGGLNLALHDGFSYEDFAQFVPNA